MGINKKIHIMIVSNKWCDCKPEHGESNSQHVIIGSLNTSGIATYDVLHYDEFSYFKRGNANDELVKRCAHTKPDLLFIDWFAIPESEYNPSLETLYIIKFKLGIPIVTIWWDTVYRVNMALAESILSFVDYNIAADSSDAYLHATGNHQKYLHLHTPYDTKIFYDSNCSRNIDVSFIGSRGGYPERREALEYLHASGINVYVAGGQREGKLSVYQYANILQRSKITLNFSNSACGAHQIKGRVFEACLCGALLLESKNNETRKKLIHETDYVEFDGKEDLRDKIEFYLTHSESRKQISLSGHNKALNLYSGQTFWARVVNLIDSCREVA